ncbi:hypothetical protein pipiens_018957, partial [Culex pipiens pipiens]
LLNEKSDDDDLEGRNRPSELLRQLQKVKDEPKEHPAPLNNEELIQMLRFQGNDRKRPSNEPDEGGAAKRPSDKPSKLCEKNKMLASLLANPAKAPTPLLPGHLPLNRIIPDIPISNVARQMASDSGIGSVGSGTFATPSSATSTTSTPMPEWDSELNEILNHVIDIAPEGNFVDSELNSLL